MFTAVIVTRGIMQLLWQYIAVEYIIKGVAIASSNMCTISKQPVLNVDIYIYINQSYSIACNMRQ